VRRPALWIAALVVVASNIAALGFVRANRSGQPEAALDLTEREARLLPRDSGNTAITLQLAWVGPSAQAQGAPGAWFDAAKLTELGFDFSAPIVNENASFYRGQAPRAVHAAFEFEGESWPRYLSSLPSDAARESAQRGPHLVLADVSLDPQSLRARYPDRRRVFIAHATVEVVFRTVPGKRPVVFGHVTQAYPIDIAVPPQLRGRFGDMRPQRRPAFDPREDARGTPLPDGPRYQVQVTWGRTWEPWLAGADRYPTKLSGKN